LLYTHVYTCFTGACTNQYTRKSESERGRERECERENKMPQKKLRKVKRDGWQWIEQLRLLLTLSTFRSEGRGWVGRI
jgi:hypothetical protein